MREYESLDVGGLHRGSNTFDISGLCREPNIIKGIRGLTESLNLLVIVDFLESLDLYVLVDFSDSPKP